MIRMNDGGADPYGRFYCGTMHYDELTGFGSLYRLDPDGSVTQVFDGVSISNGLEWTPDGALAYYNDTPTHRISVFDHSLEQGLTNRRTFVDLADEGGFPDGLTVDAEGGVVGRAVAERPGPPLRPGRAARRDRRGRRVPDHRVHVRRRRPVTLFITTSRRGITDEPAAGAIFSYDAGVRGQPARTYAG